jgi:formylglycine-generating enzyme required for sulfatase activity
MPETCPSCGHALSPGAGFCALCGTIVQTGKVDPNAYKTQSLSNRAVKPKSELLPHRYATRACPECQALVSTEAAFCTHCGHLFAAAKDAQKKIRLAVEEAEAVAHRDAPLVLEEVVQAVPAGPVELDDVVIPGVPRPTIPAEPLACPVPRRTEHAGHGDASAEAHAPIRDVTKADSPWIYADTLTVPPGMVLVPGGPFLAGNEKQQHSISEFFIDRFPVTNDDYRAFVAETGATPPDDWLDGRPLAGKERHPVVNVSYAEAEAFAAWAGKRLPTADEWEKAARGSDGRAYPWGDEFDASAVNCREAMLNTTTPVDRYAGSASPYGVCDMVGNVAEWVASDDGNVRFRGGSFLDDERNVRVTSKFVTASPNFKSFFIGFRCAQDAW